jgi:hypothetical protein
LVLIHILRVNFLIFCPLLNQLANEAHKINALMRTAACSAIMHVLLAQPDNRMTQDNEAANDPLWQQMCEAAALDPQRRLLARQALLANPAALEATVFRPDHEDPDAEEEELGEARVLVSGVFQPPADWDAASRADYYDGEDPQTFFSARLECSARPASRVYFTVEPGDLLALTGSDGRVCMYYLYESVEDDDGCHCVLIREEDLG